MGFFGFFKKTSKENILDSKLKIFIDDDFKSYKTLNFDETTTCEIILDTLKTHLGIVKNENFDQFSLVIIIKESSTGVTTFKRVINHFENIYEVVKAKPPKLQYIWYAERGSRSPGRLATTIKDSGKKPKKQFNSKNSFGKLNF